MGTVSALRRPRAAPATPRVPVYADVTSEARAAAATLAIRAASIQRALGVNFTTTATLASVPALIRDAAAALAQLEELLA